MWLADAVVVWLEWLARHQAPAAPDLGHDPLCPAGVLVVDPADIGVLDREARNGRDLPAWHWPPEVCRHCDRHAVVRVQRGVNRSNHALYCSPECRSAHIAASQRPPQQPHGPELPPPCPRPDKLRFLTYDAAHDHFAEMLERFPTLRLYRCDCGWWHAGNERDPGRGRFLVSDLARVNGDLTTLLNPTP